jgi:acyl-CoA reductase-like NAD-dependent aldehyde dehydrogenase
VHDNPTNSVLVAKTLKLYINGALTRSESGATFPAGGFEVPDASRKDIRDAVRAGASAAAGWSARDPYNRGQVIYRVAEMLEARTEDFAILGECLGQDPASARADVRQAVDIWVHYAGWADKLGQVLGSVNDVSGPFLSFTSAESLGLVAGIFAADSAPSLSTLSAVIASSLAAGNTSLVIGSGLWSMPALVFAEVLATSDVPSGVAQIASSTREEAASTAAAASQVSGLDLSLAGNLSGSLAVTAAETFTRSLCRPAPLTGVDRLRWQIERRTFWHPTSR